MVLAAKKAGIKRFIYASTSSVYGVSDQPEVTEDHPLVDKSQYNKLNSNYVNQYYQQYVPNTHTATNMQELSTENRDEILKKINYMIYLLEEQKDEKTNHDTEEVILYMFLGVFLIFLIDSFSKTNRYIR